MTQVYFILLEDIFLVGHPVIKVAQYSFQEIQFKAGLALTLD